MEKNFDLENYSGTISYIVNIGIRRLGDHVKTYDIKRALSTEQVIPMIVREELESVHEILIPFIGDHGGNEVLSQLKKIDEQNEYDVANTKMVEYIILCHIKYRSGQIQFLPRFVHKNIGGINTYLNPNKSSKISFVDSYNCLQEIISVFMAIRYFLDLDKNRLDEIRTKSHQEEDNESDSRTFRSNLSDSELHKLYNQLTNDRFIAKASPVEEFSKIFKNRLTSELKSPVIWIGGIRSLAYFFKMLYSNGVIDSHTWKAKIQQGGLFCNEKGKVPKANHLANETARDAKPPSARNKELLDAILVDIEIGM
ncbi:hypothetical protein [Dyadobacter psychrophilus]|uniref:Uncharacterized protein n=1 Tax=Dyadobacter psychrophilus TaxID=651661 RepID=A0A1T5DCC6_9BACT|nr:hypothetical protein [Dyadobacter psychrophilus]SKB69364.1 hypothetical protein SAMN05660293_01521 [Dyadobacter psychrophilus]